MEKKGGKYNLDLHIKKFIEQELIDYQDNLLRFQQFMSDAQECEEAIVLGQPDKEHLGRKNRVARPTEIKAIKLLALNEHMSSKGVFSLQNRLRAIEKALSKLNEEEMRFVKAKFWSQREDSMEALAERFYIDASTARRWNRRVLALIALEMGLM